MIKSQPSMYCEQHQPLGTREHCSPCKTARSAFDARAKALALKLIAPTYEALRASGGIGAVTENGPKFRREARERHDKWSISLPGGVEHTAAEFSHASVDESSNGCAQLTHGVNHLVVGFGLRPAIEVPDSSSGSVLGCDGVPHRVHVVIDHLKGVHCESFSPLGMSAKADSVNLSEEVSS